MNRYPFKYYISLLWWESLRPEATLILLSLGWGGRIRNLEKDDYIILEL